MGGKRGGWESLGIGIWRFSQSTSRVGGIGSPPTLEVLRCGCWLKVEPLSLGLVPGFGIGARVSAPPRPNVIDFTTFTQALGLESSLYRQARFERFGGVQLH